MKSILIIENNSELQSRYTNVLQEDGYNCFTASDGRMGVDVAIANMPALILCNISLPYIDGFGVLAVLSSNPNTVNIPFIFISTNARLSLLRKGMEMGADDFITQPFSDEQLIRAVNARFSKLKNRSKTGKAKHHNLEQCDGFKKLNEIVYKGQPRKLKKGQVLYYEGDTLQGLYFVENGCIKTTKLNADGRQLITNLYKAKSFIGIENLLLEEPVKERAETTDLSSIYFVTRQTVVDLLNEDIDLNKLFIKILSLNLGQKNDQLLELAYEPVRKRISKTLIRLAKNSHSANIIDISRDELAGLVGTATETVSRILTDFKEKGLITRTPGLIHIPDLDKLEKATR